MRLVPCAAILTIALGTAAGLCAAFKPCLAASQAPSPDWFVPPPAKPGIAGQSMDMRDFGGREEITVTAARAPIQRDPRPQETLGYQPAHSDAASPNPAPMTPSGYCNSAYQTVAGQAATGPDMFGIGSGHCD